jgi:hypothetical protein
MALPSIPELSVLGVASEAVFSIAVIIDGTVYQVISTDGQSAAQFLAQPTFVQVDRDAVMPGAAYNAETGEFTNP